MDSGDWQKEELLKGKLREYKAKFMDAMEDDLNTADAIAALFEMVKEINTSITAASGASRETIQFCADMLRELGGVLGLLQREEKSEHNDEIEELVKQRQQARKDRNWKLADEIRDKLKGMGITLEDTPQGVKIVKS